MRAIPVFLTLVLLTGCLGMPDNITPVRPFDIERYLGKWYEIARLDHSFERGLNNITATYSLRDDGAIRVINRGYSVDKGEWKEAEGRARFVGDPDQGYLKVSFFGPFYGAYVVFGLDQLNYQYAFVSGPDTSYLWLLARSPDPGQDVISEFMRQADARGFATDQLIFVDHD